MMIKSGPHISPTRRRITKCWRNLWYRLIFFYVSDALQTKIGRQSPVINIEESSDSPSEDDQDDTEEGGEEQTDTTSHSPPRDGKNDGTEEEAVEDDAASSSSSDGVSNNCISQHFLQHD